MNQSFCPRCRKTTLEMLPDGYVRCLSCGYIGDSNMDKSIIKE